MADPFDNLHSYLDSLPESHTLSDEEVEHLIPLLYRCWRLIPGGYDDRMSASKLERMEKVRWEPPCLSFIIERHGATALGSTRAELHRWTVDVQERYASYNVEGFRQLYKLAGRLNLNPVVKDICLLIEKCKDDDRLRWSPDRKQVTINMRKTLDKAAEEQDAVSGYKQTEEGRIKRFKDTIIPKLEASGWIRSSIYRLTFEKKE